MADFQTAFSFLMSNEGGFQNDPTDPGNKEGFGTKYGITYARYQAFCSKYKMTLPDASTIRSLTVDLASQFYRVEFWPLILGDKISQQAVATVLFDACVLCGPHDPIYTLQTLLVTAGGQKIAQDGSFGPKTLAALDAVPLQNIMHLWIDRMSDRFVRLSAVRNDSKWLWIWMSRRDKWRSLLLPMPTKPA